MFSPRWSKVLRDIWGYKTRTLLVVLSIAAGVFAFGTIITTRENVLKNLQAQFLASNPATQRSALAQMICLIRCCLRACGGWMA